MLWQKGESAVTIRELCEKEVVQLEQGVCLGRADDLEFDPATAQLQSLILLGRPRLLGREPDHPMAGNRNHRNGCHSGAYRRAGSTGSTSRLLAAAAGKAGSVKNRGIF
jgi:sporulation protein YlmC with PRC-barrel domain